MPAIPAGILHCIKKGIQQMPFLCIELNKLFVFTAITFFCLVVHILILNF